MLGTRVRAGTCIWNGLFLTSEAIWYCACLFPNACVLGSFGCFLATPKDWMKDVFPESWRSHSYLKSGFFGLNPRQGATPTTPLSIPTLEPWPWFSKG